MLRESRIPATGFHFPAGKNEYRPILYSRSLKSWIVKTVAIDRTRLLITPALLFHRWNQALTLPYEQLP